MGEIEGLEESVAETEEDDVQYELDLEKHSSSGLDEAIRDAVDAVERDGDDEETRGEEIETGGKKRVWDSESAKAETDSLRERLLRTLADFDNYRKRTEREKESLRRMGTFDVVKSFLGVIDNLERALESFGSVEDLKHGLQMILRQQEEILRRHGVERIDTVGQAFDPTLHQAVARQEAPDVEEPMVTLEMQKGYLLYDRLLRPAMVHVAMPVGPAAGGESSAEDPAEEASEESVREEETGQETEAVVEDSAGDAES